MRLSRIMFLCLTFWPVSADAATPKDFCQSAPLRSDALDFPSKHAWDLFVTLNHPAVDRSIERGRADCTKPIGTPGTTAVWESWRNAGRGSKIAERFSFQMARSHLIGTTTQNQMKSQGTVPAPTAKLASTGEDRTSDQISFHDMALLNRIKPQFSPIDGTYSGEGAFGETRINRATYEFIKRECLWSIDGLQRYAQAFHAGKKPAMTFPPDAMEVKAGLMEFHLLKDR